MSTQDACTATNVLGFCSLPPIEDEAVWRSFAQERTTSVRQDLRVARWQDTIPGYRKLVAPPSSAHFTIEVLLSDAVIDCYRDGRLIRSGVAAFGATQIAAPGEKITCFFERPVDAIHIFASTSLVSSQYEELHARKSRSPFVFADPAFAADPIMGKLGFALVESNSMRNPYAGQYCKYLALSILARAMEANRSDTPSSSSRVRLVPLRVRSAINFIDENLSERLTLRVIAQHAGLSRMHFAAQFKLATGLSPHAFVLERRIQAASKMLLVDRFRIVDIALSVGFYSQTHFTTEFRRTIGMTPARWREEAAAKGAGLQLSAPSGYE